ncbi:hypothetical protein Taro_013111 [Colocasia esculenta]|uniref:Uncharacterized protein n=1 Tax=Colocasia esculenta TaxID=4460 RepID=A0A843UFG8_COLES|nr:hypothetical protein [Colocasia esculenta]
MTEAAVVCIGLGTGGSEWLVSFVIFLQDSFKHFVDVKSRFTFSFLFCELYHLLFTQHCCWSSGKKMKRQKLFAAVRSSPIFSNAAWIYKSLIMQTQSV